MRAAFHPNGPRLYLNSIGPEGWPTPAGDTVRPGVRVLTYDYDLDGCRVGAFLGATEMGPGAPNGERAYGLTVDPAGRFLYQTTASLRRIRLYDLDDEGMPVPRTDYDVTGNGAHVCAQTRRLALHPDRRVLYANCNNGEAGPEVDEALQVWRVADDGSISLMQHHTLENMNGGVLDPVIHPSGDWLYQFAGAAAGWQATVGAQFAVGGSGLSIGPRVYYGANDHEDPARGSNLFGATALLIFGIGDPTSVAPFLWAEIGVLSHGFGSDPNPDAGGRWSAPAAAGGAGTAFLCEKSASSWLVATIATWAATST